MCIERIDIVLSEEIHGGADEQLADWDLPPEFCHYQDEGCELAGSCLDCPFPQCVYDEPGGKRHWQKEQRNRQILKMFKAEGRGIGELAETFGVSRRTVQRALKNTLPVTAGEIKKEDRLERVKR